MFLFLNKKIQQDKTCWTKFGQQKLSYFTCYLLAYMQVYSETITSVSDVTIFSLIAFIISLLSFYNSIKSTNMSLIPF